MVTQRRKRGYSIAVALLSAALLAQPAMTAQAAGGVQLKECGALGKALSSGEYASFEELEGGYIKVGKKAGNALRYGILDKEGKELLPCTMDICEQISDHMIVMGVIGKETNNKDEAMFYQTNQTTVSVTAREGDTMYTGYMVAYDLAQKKELSFTKVTKPGASGNRILACGESLYVVGDDGGRKIYDMKGKELSNDAKNLEVHKPFYVKKENGVSTVYDDKMKKLFEKENNTINIGQPNIEKGTCVIFQDKQSQKYGLLDTKGKELVKGEYDSITPFGNTDLLRVKKGKTSGLMDDKGKMAVPCEYDDVIFLWEGGYAYASKTNAEGKQVCTLIGPDGILLEDSADAAGARFLISYRESGKEYEYFLLKDKKFSLKQKNRGTAKAFCLLEVRDPAKNKVGLIETMSGKQVLDPKYDKIETESSRGYVFAYLDGKCTAYRIEVPK